SAINFFVETSVASVRPVRRAGSTLRVQPVTAFKKIDRKRRNTSSSNRWRLKSGYLSHLFKLFDLSHDPVLENRTGPNAKAWKNRSPPFINVPVTPLLHMLSQNSVDKTTHESWECSPSETK